MWENTPQAPSIMCTSAHRADCYHPAWSRASMYFSGNKYKHSQQIMVLNIHFSVSKTLLSILAMPGIEHFLFCEFKEKKKNNKSRFSSSLLPNPLSKCFITDLKSLVGPWNRQGLIAHIWASLPIYTAHHFSDDTLESKILLDVHWPGYKHETIDPYIISGQYSLKWYPHCCKW